MLNGKKKKRERKPKEPNATSKEKVHDPSAKSDPLLSYYQRHKQERRDYARARYATRKEEQREYQALYRQNNKEKVREYTKKWNKQKIQCDCGIIITQSAMHYHKKSKRHQKMIDNKNQNAPKAG
jgi:hypothetical protein